MDNVMNWRVESVDNKISKVDSCSDPDLTALQLGQSPEEYWEIQDLHAFYGENKETQHLDFFFDAAANYVIREWFCLIAAVRSC